VMITNQYVAEIYELVDPTRLGAQVISGIGFLGVGTIIVTRELQVKGLTTAAGLLSNACMGLAFVIGLYEGAILGTAFIFLAITIMHGLDNRVLSQSRAVEVYVELTEDSKLSAFLESLHQNNFEVSHIEIVKAKYGEHKGIAAIISLWLPHRQAHYEVIDQLNQTKAIDYIEEI
ncbi:MAG: MgtC/SapB family protein, partial [Clostridiales bacterium]|nr:MgtC/SapB family protein [Clostridiales bacterium]